MKAEILAQIDALQAERDQAQQELQAKITAINAQINEKTSLLNKLMAEIPSEFHSMTQEVFDKLKAYFS